MNINVKNAPSWAWFKGIYAVVGLALAGLGAAGIVSESEAATLADNVNNLVMLAAAGVFGVVTRRTGPNSGNDQPVAPVEDIRDAVRDALAEGSVNMNITGTDAADALEAARIRAERNLGMER